MCSARLMVAGCIAFAVLAGCGGQSRAAVGPLAAPTEPTAAGGDGSDTGGPAPEDTGTDCGCDAPDADSSGDTGASDSAGDDTDSGGDSGGDTGGDGELRWASSPTPIRARAAVAVPKPPGCIHGVVEDAQGRPVVGASAAIDVAGAATATTGRTGHFCLTWDRARTTFVAVVAPDGAQAWFVVDTDLSQVVDARGCAALRAVVAGR